MSLEPTQAVTVSDSKKKELPMPRDVENEPGLAPSADTHAEKSEKVRAGKAQPVSWVE